MDDFESQLIDARYEGIAFPCADVHVDEGHDSAEHTVRGRRGADIEPTGLRALRGSMKAMMLNGLRNFEDQWPGPAQDLIRKFRETPIGELTHPTEGVFTAHIKAWPRTYTPDVRNGVVIDIEWVEHRGTVSALPIVPGDAAPQDGPSRATQQAQEADATATAGGRGVPSVASSSAAGAATSYVLTAPVVASGLASLAAASPLGPQAPTSPAAAASQAAAAVAARTMLDVVDHNLGLASLAPAIAHDAVVALERLRATLVALTARYLGDPSRLRRYVCPQDMALWEVAVAVYGDPREAPRLQAANRIPVPRRLRRGTALVVPPR